MDNLKTILIVDDNEVNIQTLLELLGNKYDILASLDGEQALEILNEEKVDLVLLDIMMPGIDGFEVCRRIKADKKTHEIPVIFITAKTDENSIEEAYEVGGVDYITKPFSAKEILSRVNSHIALSNQTKKLEEDLEENSLVLEQYKQIIDKSMLVSKTDLKGNITYVNEAFVEVSGFKEEELLGKSHNIVRHLEMPKDAFKDMWKTIKEKKMWQGEVKNLKKNGQYYVVQATVMPILDSHGNIVEYISIRKDITKEYDLQKEIEETQKEVVFTMGAIGETRSKETGNHVKRVAEYSRTLAKCLGLSDEKVTLLADASPMHDIGKVAINDNILHKPGKLTDDEFVIMRTHAELGYKMLAHSNRPLLKTAAKIALEHHERWDGNGYPRHLKGEEISIEGRITAIADVFDALGSDRVYKQAWEDEKIFQYIKDEKGKQFDPCIVDAFFDNLDEILQIRERFRDV